MPNEIRLRFKRASLSVALVASILCVGSHPVFAQAKENSGGTTVQKNSDGSVEAYDEGESAQSESVDTGGGENGTMQKGYRPGTSPYQKKFSDGTTVKRNADGSIETWDEGETQHYRGGVPVTGGGGGATHKRTTKHAKTSSSKARSTKAKVTTTTTTTGVKKRGDLLRAAH